MAKVIVYIHGKGGNSLEAEHYRNLFDGYEVIGFDYKSENPWDAQAEFSDYFKSLEEKYESIILIANSIGAHFALNSLNEVNIDKAFLISPIVNIEKLIEDMMMWAGVSLKELEEKKRIETAFGETLSIDYLNWVKKNPVKWEKKTYVLYGDKDNMQSIETIIEFVNYTDSKLTVMENGEHWFHTDEQMKFLDKWIMENR